MKLQYITHLIFIFNILQFSQGNLYRVSRKLKKSKSTKNSKTSKNTNAPTIRPSISPQPSQNPTDVPSVSPTISHMPSSLPTRIPSTNPTLTPSRTPSSSPSKDPTLHPSSIPTTTPSASPTISHMPSIKPSSNPSETPSLTPSLRPSSDPSSIPTNVPTSQPSPQPSNQPSLRPSAFPSSSPSISPSFLPSIIPSSSPSKTPSINPSLTPSVSSRPSSTPSISQLPTIETISGIKEVRGEDGQVGIQAGCPIPQNKDSASYAEESIIRHVVSFFYTVTVIDESSLDNVVDTVETRINQKVFTDYVNCTTGRRLKSEKQRYLEDSVQANATAKMSGEPHPIGVSSLPNDKRSDDMSCPSSNAGYACFVIDGAITFLFETDASFSPFLQQNDALAFVRNNLAGAIDDVDGISGISYMGAMDGLPSNNVDAIIPRVDRSEVYENKQHITPFGFTILTGAGVVVLAAMALLTMKKIKSKPYHTINQEFDPMNLSSIIPKEGEDSSSYTSSNFQSNDGVPLDNISEGANDSCTHDVHRCTSATCEACEQDTTQEALRFVSVDSEDAGFEVDMMGNILQSRYIKNGILRSPSSLCNSVRSYDTPDTVEF